MEHYLLAWSEICFVDHPFLQHHKELVDFAPIYKSSFPIKHLQVWDNILERQSPSLCWKHHVKVVKQEHLEGSLLQSNAVLHFSASVLSLVQFYRLIKDVSNALVLFGFPTAASDPPAIPSVSLEAFSMLAPSVTSDLISEELFVSKSSTSLRSFSIFCDSSYFCSFQKNVW